jgi:hypothetical protein
MRLAILLFFLSFLLSCESGVVARDNRQITAKNEIREKLPPRSGAFDITGFREDTLASWPDTMVKRPIRYTLDFEYNDSTGLVQKKTGYVIFTPDGRSVLSTQIVERNNPLK